MEYYIWSDMYIETTFVKPETIKNRAPSLHSGSRLVEDTGNINDTNEAQIQEILKEEMKSRIAADAVDREAITKRLELCIDP
ncbi:unnamed protein product [Caretta caretta]